VSLSGADGAERPSVETTGSWDDTGTCHKNHVILSEAKDLMPVAGGDEGPRVHRRPFSKVAVPSPGGVAFRIVMAMKQHFAGEARAALLAAMTANMRPKIVIVVDPDIDVPGNAIGPVQVALMPKSGLRLLHAAGARPDRGRCAARRHARPLGRLLAAARPADRLGGGHRREVPVRGGDQDRGSDRPVSRDICGPAPAEKGHEYIEVADVPGWREYEFPELKAARR
jgi:4-hydroxy-3-polyprenylbenzoate decarboxylase/2,5-furandicarboxylate decarboxylase 1